MRARVPEMVCKNGIGNRISGIVMPHRQLNDTERAKMRVNPTLMTY